MNLILLMLLAIVPVSHTETRDHCDLVEHNSFYDCFGRHVYDQTIFYEWNPSLHRYHVRAWVLSDGDKQPQRDYRNGLWITKYTERDSAIERTITSTHYRRSYSQVDPERDNKRLLPEHERHALIKRSVTKEVTE
jgi:hypothetical protein